LLRISETNHHYVLLYALGQVRVPLRLIVVDKGWRYYPRMSSLTHNKEFIVWFINPGQVNWN